MAQYLKTLKAGEFPKPSGGKIITIDAHARARDAMKVLVDNNILSAPVYDHEIKGYVGMIDMMDMCDFIVKSFDKEHLALGDSFAAVMEQAIDFGKTRVTDLVDFSSRDPWVPVTTESSLYDIVKVMAEKNVKRVPVFDHDNHLINLITQSSVVNLLAHHLESLGGLSTKTVDQLDIGHGPVVTVDMSDHVVHAFHVLREKNVSAVAVVNKLVGPAIVATLSIKDIRNITKSPADLYQLYEPISHFIRTIHDDDVNICNPTIVCKPSTTLSEIFAKLAASKIHRLWVIDSHYQPTKCISLTDVLSALFQ